MNGMEQLEKQLREAFRPVEAPPELERRILERVRRRPAWRPAKWAALAASVLLVLGGSLGVMRWQEQRLREQQAEEVRRQLALTLEIASQTLAKTEARLKSIGVEQVRLQEASWQEH